MADLMVASDDNHDMVPNLALAQLLYEYEVKAASSSSTTDTSLAALKSDIFSIIEASNMTEIYTQTCDKYSIAHDDAKLLAMK